MANFKIEMRVGQEQRTVTADRAIIEGGWLVFYNKPPEGGTEREYWRVNTSDVVSMETKR